MYYYDEEMQIYHELHNIISGETPNGYERLQELYESGQIDAVQYNTVSTDLDRMVGRQYH